MAKFFISLAALIILVLPVTVSGENISEATATAVPAVSTGAIDTGDTAWILISTALVMLMTPGLALFYGGMVRGKNVLGTLMQSFVAIALISVQWILVGYSLSFGPDINGIIGNLDWIGLNGVGIEPNPDYAPTIPHMAFMMYQAMFAVITPALITGAFAERMKFSAYVLFILLWSTVVYDPVAHWVWGTGGWLKQMGVLDFAGGIVVHLISGISALAAALMIGRRIFAGGNVSTQSSDDGLGYRPSLVRLVRVQRRKRSLCRHSQYHGIRRNTYFGRIGDTDLGNHRMDS
jgi:ammonium transporter, Amt family